VNGIRKIRLADTVIIQLQIAAQKISDLRCDRLINKILQFEALLL